MTRLIKFFKNLVSSPKIRECRLDPGTNEYYCYEKVQGVYQRVSGPYPDMETCKGNCERRN